MPDDHPRLTFVQQTPQTVTFAFIDMPAGVKVFFIDVFTKVRGEAAYLSGTGQFTAPTTHLTTGDYYLSARSDAETEIARSIKFHVETH